MHKESKISDPLILGIMTYQYYLGKEIDRNSPSVLGVDKYNDYKLCEYHLVYTH